MTRACRACRICAWWLGEDRPEGQCRAVPPVPTLAGYTWPITASEGWCGQYRVSEEVVARGETERVA